MFHRLNQYLKTNKILVPKQTGFRKRNTSEKAIITLTDNILTSLDH